MPTGDRMSCAAQEKQMSYGKEKLLDQFVSEARKHTGVLMYTPKCAPGPTHFGCASCVYVEYRSRRFAITSEHVIREASAVYILAIVQSNQPTPLGPTAQLIPANVVKVDADHDVAILDAQTIDLAAAQRYPFVLETSDFITQRCLEDPPGLLAFIYGVLGSKTEIVPNGKNFYVEGPSY